MMARGLSEHEAWRDEGGELPTGSPLCEVCAELLEASPARAANGGGCGELYAEQRALVHLSDV